MALKDVRIHFKSINKLTKSTVSFSHDINRGTLIGSDKTWIRKEMPNPAVAKIEIMSQEFFRLIIPYQPETRLLYDPATNVHYILSEEIQGYRKLPRSPSNYADGTYTGLGLVLLCSLFFEEIDLKNGNIGLDALGRVNKIDGDWCFGHRYDKQATFGLTPKAIASLPYRSGFYAFNWLDLTDQGFDTPTSQIVSSEVTNSKAFRSEVNEAILKLCLLPDHYITRFVYAFMPGMALPFIRLIKERRDELQNSALQNPSFQKYLRTSKAKSDIADLITHMNSFIANGDNAILPDDVEVKKRSDALIEPIEQQKFQEKNNRQLYINRADKRISSILNKLAQKIGGIDQHHSETARKKLECYSINCKM